MQAFVTDLLSPTWIEWWDFRFPAAYPGRSPPRERILESFRSRSALGAELFPVGDADTKTDIPAEFARELAAQHDETPPIRRQQLQTCLQTVFELPMNYKLMFGLGTSAEKLELCDLTERRQLVPIPLYRKALRNTQTPIEGLQTVQFLCGYLSNRLGWEDYDLTVVKQHHQAGSLDPEAYQVLRAAVKHKEQATAHLVAVCGHDIVFPLDWHSPPLMWDPINYSRVWAQQQGRIEPPAYFDLIKERREQLVVKVQKRLKGANLGKVVMKFL